MAWSRWFSGILILGTWLLLCGAQPVSVQQEKSSCVRCHHEATVEAYGGHLFSDWEGSVHAKNRVGCEDCHGGNPSEQEKEAAHGGVHPSNNPKSRVYFRNVPFTCGGRCHIKEYKGFTQSDHYRKLETSGKGPNCVTCHGSMAASVLGPEKMEEVCVNCHNPRLGISPAKAREARDMVLLMEETRTILEWARELIKRAQSEGEEVSPSEKVLDQATLEYRAAQGRWHTFEMEALRKGLQETYRLARAARQKAEKRPLPKKGSQSRPAGPPEISSEMKLSAVTPRPTVGSNQEECLDCHRIATPRIAREYEQSVHEEADMGCAGCHRGDVGAKDQEAAHSARKGFVGAISLKEVPSLCGGCHADIERMRPYRLDAGVYREYLSSRHGRLFAQGDLKVATCTSCHGSHGVLSRKDPDSPSFKKKIPETCGRCHSDPELMRPYGIPTDQVVQYREGIHGRILFEELPGKDPTLVPTCVDCHGGHGAAPPDLQTVHAVCGACHSYEQQYFKMGPHYESARRIGTPRCIDCHGNHRNTIPAGKLLMDGEKESCGSCHREGEEGYRVAVELKGVLEQADRVLSDFRKSRAGQLAVTPADMFLEGEATRLRDRFSALRKATHSLDIRDAQERLGELQGMARNAQLYHQKVLSQKEEGIGPLLLILGGAATGVGILSLAAAFLILRWRRGGEGKGPAGHEV